MEIKNVTLDSINIGPLPEHWKGTGIFPITVTGEQAMNEKQQPSIGRIVHYVIPHLEGESRWLLPGAHRPAIIVEVFHGGDQEQMGAVALQVFLDGPRDSEPAHDTIWRSFVPYDESGQKGHTWHWPERV